ncbi:MAG: DEAD/DEAH box helicase [Candidatus Andersenbacteria bacterium]|nr:DEAD/DEAH box helicase [Candidatus Andersenbacteria bacterium]MBI3250906.1 DEAD/DEAH box helicase [Candidatus Andersenbacteria bacterium]
MTTGTPSAQGVSFSDLGLSPKLLGVLSSLKFTIPTPIQLKAIPIAAAGKDVIGIAQTGTGKTLAFALPLLQQASLTKKQGLIIVPTRELAAQVAEQFNAIGKSFGLRQALLIGGGAMYHQIEQIKKRPHVIIGTPGRIIDHLEGKRLNLSSVGILVLDEADRMLDMGFAPQIKQILKHVPKQRQTMLFSATMPSEIVKIAQEHMKMPVRVEVARAGTIAERVNQELFIIERNDKLRLLDKLLNEYYGTVLVFSRTKYGAKKICRSVRHMGHSVAEIHSNLSLPQRRRSLEGFKSGKFRVLIATDIAARGIDVTDIEVVINFDLPDSPDDYVHRVGRTGRAGKTGHAITFITPDQRSKIRMIERLVRQQLRISPLPELPAARAMPAHVPTSSGYQHRNRRVFRRPTRQQPRYAHKSSGRGARIHS